MSSLPSLWEFERPLDEVQLYGDFNFTRTEYDKIITSVIEGTRRSKRSTGLFHLLGEWGFDGGANTLHLDVRKARGRSGRGHRKTQISLAQEWFPSARSRPG